MLFWIFPNQRKVFLKISSFACHWWQAAGKDDPSASEICKIHFWLLAKDSVSNPLQTAID
jgi:hypothetical protein